MGVTKVDLEEIFVVNCRREEITKGIRNGLKRKIITKSTRCRKILTLTSRTVHNLPCGEWLINLQTWNIQLLFEARLFKKRQRLDDW